MAALAHAFKLLRVDHPNHSVFVSGEDVVAVFGLSFRIVHECFHPTYQSCEPEGVVVNPKTYDVFIGNRPRPQFGQQPAFYPMQERWIHLFFSAEPCLLGEIVGS